MTAPVRVALITVSTAAWFALSLAAFGGWAAYFADPARAALAWVLLAVYAVSLFIGGDLSPGVKEDRSNRWVLPVFAVIGLLDGWLPAYCDRHWIWVFSGEPVRWTGVVLFAAGCALRLWPVHVLGRRFSGLVAIQKDHELVTDGIYGVIRHPSYLGMLVMLLGWGLAFRSVAGVILTVLIIPPLLARIHAEERLLAEQFGEQYRAYRALTPARLIPGIY